MVIKNLIGAIICGAGSALGYILVTKGVEELSDPVKRAKIKDVFCNIKGKFVKKAES